MSNCLQYFSSKEIIIANHGEVCLEIIEKQANKISQKGSNIKFIEIINS